MEATVGWRRDLTVCQKWRVGLHAAPPGRAWRPADHRIAADPRTGSTMRGIISAAGYVPHRRLDARRSRSSSAPAAARAPAPVASYDEDTTTMGVEAARLALRRRRRRRVARALLVRDRRRPPTSTRPTPPTIHAALRLDRDGRGLRLRRRGALGHRRAARRAARRRARVLVVAADIRTGLPDRGRRGRRRRAARRPAGRRRHRPDRSSPSCLGAGVGHRGVPRPLAHARRAALAASGRSASARRSTSRSPSRRGTRR